VENIPGRTGTLHGLDDARLVAMTLEGTQEAFGEIVRRYERPVWSLVLRMVRDEAVAEELAQDVFWKAYQALASYQQGRKFSSWLFKIAHNATIDHLRRRRPSILSLDAAADDEAPLGERLPDEGARTPEEQAGNTDLGEALAAAVEALRPEYREIVLLRFHQGLAYQEVADVTGLPLGTVKTYLHRARKELAARLGEEGWAP
jgi:RNA polymerase sigma-70 factor, ECF subfamily